MISADISGFMKPRNIYIFFIHSRIMSVGTYNYEFRNDILTGCTSLQNISLIMNLCLQFFFQAMGCIREEKIKRIYFYRYKLRKIIC